MSHLGQDQVAIVEIAEDRLQLLAGAARGLGLLAEAWREDLEHVAEPLSGDAHVVLRLACAPGKGLVGKTTQLIESHQDDPRGIRPQGTARVEALHRARLHGPAALASFFRRRRSFLSRFAAT